MWPGRTGAESTKFLIHVSEAYLSKHLLEGFEPSSVNTELEKTRAAVEAGDLSGNCYNPAEQLQVVVHGADSGGAGAVTHYFLPLHGV